MLQQFKIVGLLRLTGILMQFVIIILFTRILGPSDFGTYAFFMSLSFLISSPLQMAVNTFAVRWVPRDNTLPNKQLARQAIKYGEQFVLRASLIIFFVVMLFVWMIARESVLVPLILGFFSFLMIINEWYSGLIRASHRVGFSLILESLIRPIILIFIALLAVFEINHKIFSINDALASQFISAAIALLSGYWIRKKLVTIKASVKVLKKTIRRLFRKSMRGYVIQGMLVSVQAQGAFVILWFLEDSSDVGFLKIAIQLSMIVAIGLSISQVAIASHFSKAIAGSNHTQAAMLFKKATEFGLLVGVPVVVIFILFSQDIIIILFGREYISAATPLVILSVAQLLNLLTGPVGTALNMAGHQKYVISSMVISVIAQYGLGVLLAYNFGLIGMAFGVAIGIVIMNFVLLIGCIRELNIVRLPFWNFN
jgi:O-antigen/teichoic acid export membrane protein